MSASTRRRAREAAARLAESRAAAAAAAGPPEPPTPAPGRAFPGLSPEMEEAIMSQLAEIFREFRESEAANGPVSP